MHFSVKKLFLKTIGRFIPSDFFASRFPVSIKGVFLIENKIVLLKNERNEWDLPGGKLNRNESFMACLQREIQEELNISVQVKEFLKVDKIRITNRIDVIVMVYFCTTYAKESQLQISGESFGVGLFGRDELSQLNIPKLYLNIIQQQLK